MVVCNSLLIATVFRAQMNTTKDGSLRQVTIVDDCFHTFPKKRANTQPHLPKLPRIILNVQHLYSKLEHREDNSS